MRSRQLTGAMRAAYRRTGADLPGGDPRPTHGAEMEGWFWRFTDVDRRRTVVALCGLNRHEDGPWATVAVAAHPGGLVRSAAVDGARASSDTFEVAAGDVFAADEDSVHVDLGEVQLSARVDHRVHWPLRLGGGGVFSAVPFLGQYWHPHVLGGHVTGRLAVGGEEWDLDGSDVYAEKNWGAGFPDRWWWGQAQGFADRQLCVAFGGGRLDAGPVAIDVTGCVVRLGAQVARFAPPLSRVRAEVGAGAWELDARRPGWRVEIEGEGAGVPPVVLPVPVPSERRNVDRDIEHLAAWMRLRVWRRGRVVVDDESSLAGLEVGSTDPERAMLLASDLGVERSSVG